MHAYVRACVCRKRNLEAKLSPASPISQQMDVSVVGKRDTETAERGREGRGRQHTETECGRGQREREWRRQSEIRRESAGGRKRNRKGKRGEEREM